VTSPDDPHDSDKAVPALDRLHQQALAGEVTAEELLKTCRQHILRAVRRRSYTDPYLRDIDVEDHAGRVLANLVTRVGGDGDQAGLFPGITYLTAYVNAAVTKHLNSVYKGRKDGRELRTRSIDEPLRTKDGEERRIEPANPDPAIDIDRIAAAAAYAKARRRTARLRAEATAGRRCPFHMAGPCPHTDSVIDFIEQMLASDPVPTDEDIADWLVEKGRTLSMPANRTGAGRKRKSGPPQALSDHDHTLDRHFRRCFEWWWYRAFLRTDLDPVTERPADRKPNEPSSAADRLRLPIVGRLRLTGNGDWQSGACSLSGALKLILTDEEFWRLLYARKREVYDYLEGKTS
jgi:hypothetical protein